MLFENVKDNVWIFLSETCYYLQKLVPFARCCTSRNFYYVVIDVLLLICCYWCFFIDVLLLFCCYRCVVNVVLHLLCYYWCADLCCYIVLSFFAIVVLLLLCYHVLWLISSIDLTLLVVTVDSSVILYRNQNLYFSEGNQFLSLYNKDFFKSIQFDTISMSNKSLEMRWKILVVVACKYSENPCFDHLSEIFFPP